MAIRGHNIGRLGTSVMPGCCWALGEGRFLGFICAPFVSLGSWLSRHNRGGESNHALSLSLSLSPSFYPSFSFSLTFLLCFCVPVSLSSAPSLPPSFSRFLSLCFSHSVSLSLSLSLSLCLSNSDIEMRLYPCTVPTPSHTSKVHSHPFPCQPPKSYSSLRSSWI